MGLKVNDLVATILIVAIAVPYVDLLVGGDLTLVEDTRGMAGTGLVAGALAYYALARHDALDKAGKAATALAVASLALGFTTYQLSDTDPAPVLLALFMASLLVVWGAKIAHHAGLRLAARHLTRTP